MTVPGPSDRWIWYGGYDLGVSTGLVGEVAVPGIERPLPELTGSLDSNPVHHDAVFERPDGSLVIPFWADDSIQTLIDSIRGGDEGESLACYGYEGAPPAIGDSMIAVRTIQSAVRSPVQSTTVNMHTLETQSNGIPENGTVLHSPASAETADGDTESSSYDSSSSSSDGGAGYLQYRALDDDGGTGLDVRVLDSSDDATFVELIAFTTVTDASTDYGFERLTVTGTVDRYLASDWDFTGTPGGGETCIFLVGFTRF